MLRVLVLSSQRCGVYFPYADRVEKTNSNFTRTPIMIENKKKPNPIDIHVGSRIRLRRTLLGMSQQKLGEAIGLTFQQVQKYERGANRVGSSRMFELARVLDVPISYFFEEMGSDTAQRG